VGGSLGVVRVPVRGGQEENEFIWIPAHDPAKDPVLARGDRRMFALLYELYQMALVDTSRLLTTSTPITISK
jgi:hypothetical protein